MTRVDFIVTLVLTSMAPIVWGSTYIVTTELLPANSPLVAATMRALPAGILLVLAGRVLPQGHWWSRLAILGLLNIGLFFFCLFYAANALPGGMAALLMSMQPIFVMIFGFVLLNSDLSMHQLCAGFIGIAGIALLVFSTPSELDTSGIWVGLLGAASMASGVVLTKRWGRPKNMTLLSFTGWQLLFGGVLLLPIALEQEGLPVHLTSTAWLGYGYLGLVGAVMAYALWFRGIEKLPATTVSFLGLLSSVSAVLLGYLFLDQALTPLQCVGAISIFLSIILAAQKATSNRPLRVQKAV
ncbi:DMT family transporter [Microbulbifer sp. TYP-18]|uniref:DMT family transporter n=1 Tax=Microbulbifer sp. TYP-18 TaxID=3230024 RepID=UPI0034C6CEDD